MLCSMHYFMLGVKHMVRYAGELKINLSSKAICQSFTPSPLPPNPSIAFDRKMVWLLVKANKKITLLEGARHTNTQFHGYTVPI